MIRRNMFLIIFLTLILFIFQITDAFNSSATLLTETYKEQGLTVDNVENVVDKAAEVRLVISNHYLLLFSL